MALLVLPPAFSQVTANKFITYPGTEYISGKTGVGQKMKGALVIKEDEVVFQTKEGRPVFAIPVKTVTGVSSATEVNPGSLWRQVVLEDYASKREEYLTIKTETTEGAEAVVFKVKKKTSEAMAAKIDFFRKKAKAAPPQ